MPDIVNPDRWLQVSDGLHVVRTVRRNGMESRDLKDYYVARALAGQRVALHLNAKERCWIVLQGTQRLKTLPLKGLYAAALSFEDFVQFMMQQASTGSGSGLRSPTPCRGASADADRYG